MRPAALCYEGLPWFTGAAVMAGGAARLRASLLLAALYSIGAHGIMTLNDFKSIEGDRRMGIGSLPVLLGVDGAARVACIVDGGAAGRRHRPAAARGAAGCTPVAVRALLARAAAC